MNNTRKAVEWVALRELYKVDLESFVAFDGDIEFSNAIGGMETGGNGYEEGQTEAYGEEQYGDDV